METPRGAPALSESWVRLPEEWRGGHLRGDVIADITIADKSALPCCTATTPAPARSLLRVPQALCMFVMHASGPIPLLSQQMGLAPGILIPR